MIHKVALVAAIVLPFWNLPLMIRMIRRKSSEDISVFWALGVWICLLLMAPSAFISEDVVWRVFNIVNLIFFSMVMFCVFFYRKR